MHNEVVGFIRQYETLTNETVFERQDPIQIDRGGSVTLFADFEGLGAVTDLDAPVSNVDYMAFNNMDGSGANRSSLLAVDVEISQFNEIKVSINYPVSPGVPAEIFITSINIKGSVLNRLQPAKVPKRSDSSIEKYKLKTLELRDTWIQSQANMEARIDAILALLDTPETRLQFSWYVPAYADFRALELSDRIRLKLPAYTDDGYIEHLALYMPLSGVLPVCTIQATVTAAMATPPPPPPMAEVPEKPSRVTLTATSTSITVTLPSDPDNGGAAITARDIRYRETGTFSWTRIDSVGTTHTIFNLTTETEYEVQWRAVNSVGDGPWSDSRSITTPAMTMTGDSVTVPLTGLSSFTNYIRWSDNQSLGSTFDANDQEQVLTTLDLNNAGPAGQVFISIVGSNNRFTPEFEASGRIIFEASDGETLEVMIADADMSEAYTWVPSNSAEVVAFVLHVKGLTDQDATLTLSE